MKDRDLEDVLREELHRRVTPGEPSSRLVDHVARLGEEPSAPGGFAVLLRRRAAAVGGLALVALVAAVMVGGLYWRTTNQAKPSVSATPATPSPVLPAQTPKPAKLPAWQGSNVNVDSFHRLASGFVWVVGAAGQHETLYTSPDDGVSWTQMDLPQGARFVTFTDPSHAFALTSLTAEVRGATNSFLRSSDGGRTWTKSLIIDHSGFQPVSLDMVDSQHGWAMLVNLATVFWLWTTTDGGVTWSPLVDSSKWAMSAPVPPPNTPPAPGGIDFLSPAEGFGWSHEGVVHSLDGGKTWTTVGLPSLASSNVRYSAIARNGDPGHLILYALAIDSSAESSLSYRWVVLTSADDGSSWAVASSQSLGDRARPVSDSDNDLSGFVTLQEGQTGPFETPAGLSLVTPAGNLASFATTGLDALAKANGHTEIQAAVAASTNEAWVTINTCAPHGPMSGIAFVLCPRLVATFDAGKSWQTVLWNPSTAGASPTPALAPACCQMNPVNENQRPREPLVEWLDANAGWAVIAEKLYWTADGGSNWDSGSPLPASGTIQFLDRQHGFLTASDSSDPGGPNYDRSQVYRTVDGGKSWTSSALPLAASDANWTWAHFTDVQHGVVARCPQLIAGQQEAACQTFTTDDGGVSFTSAGTKQLPTPVTWISLQVGWGVGYEMISADEQAGPPILYLTSDGGRNWQSAALALPSGGRGGWSRPLTLQLAPGGSGRLLVWIGTNGNDGIMAGYATSDGGANWRLDWQEPAQYLSVTAVRPAGDALIGLDGTGTYFWRSSDFGRTWQKLGPAPVEVHDFVFADPTTGWLVRAPGYGESPDALMKTVDGGMTWQVVIRAPTNITNP